MWEAESIDCQEIEISLQKIARKSSPATKGPAQTDSGDVLKRCNEYSRKSLSRNDSSAKTISERKALVDVSTLRNNSTSSGGSSSSKTSLRRF
ncbi:hypothetical protein ACHQM5_025664 [Ranunculus cassubicifolius]